MISCHVISRPEIFNENRFGTNKKILSSGENYHFMIKVGDCYCIHLFSVDKNSETELKDLDTKIIT